MRASSRSTSAMARCQLGVAFGQPRRAIAGRPRLSDHLRAPAGPLGWGNEIRIRIGIAATVCHPDIPGAQRTAQVPQGAQFIVPATETAVRSRIYGRHMSVTRSMGASRGTGRRVGARSRVRMTSTARRTVSSGPCACEGQRLQKRGRKLPNRAVACAKEVNGTIMARAESAAAVSSIAARTTAAGTRAKLIGPHRRIVDVWRRAAPAPSSRERSGASHWSSGRSSGAKSLSSFWAAL